MKKAQNYNAKHSDRIVINLSHNLPIHELAELTAAAISITGTTGKCYMTTPESRMVIAATMPKFVGVNWNYRENTNYIDLTFVDDLGTPVAIPTIPLVSMVGELCSRLSELRFEYESNDLSVGTVRVHFDGSWQQFLADIGLNAITEIMSASLQPFYMGREIAEINTTKR